MSAINAPYLLSLFFHYQGLQYLQKGSSPCLFFISVPLSHQLWSWAWHSFRCLQITPLPKNASATVSFHTDGWIKVDYRCVSIFGDESIENKKGAETPSFKVWDTDTEIYSNQLSQLSKPRRGAEILDIIWCGFWYLPTGGNNANWWCMCYSLVANKDG